MAARVQGNVVTTVMMGVLAQLLSGTLIAMVQWPRGCYGSHLSKEIHKTGLVTVRYDYVVVVYKW